MTPRLTDLSEREALIYLGYRGGGLPEDIGEALARCKQTVLSAARPRAVWRAFPWAPDRPLPGTDFIPGGQNIRTLLQDCHTVIFFGATLGAEIEALLRKAQIKNMADAVILDACASAAIENVCDNLCADFEAELGGCCTDRFSPGYGDFPFAQQAEVVRLLDLPRRIGVSLSPGGLMIPQKSVTALLGVSARPQPRRFRGCAYCNQFDHCTLRKEGVPCGSAN